jgi:hypothetical protein
MFNDSIDLISSKYEDRLGYYVLNNKKYNNRFNVMMDAKKIGSSYSWHFNDDTFGAIDWMRPIETPLNELYRLRAQQLRNTYDYLILHFSGGIDSTTMLHSFIDNGIFVDEIVMQLPANFKGKDTDDKTEGNHWSEIEYQAIPHLKKYQHLIDPRTKIRFQDISVAVYEFLEKDNWAESIMPCTNYNPTGLARMSTQAHDPHVLELLMSGKTIGRLYGIDKPKVRYHNGGYYAYFSDLGIYTQNTPPVSQEYVTLYKQNKLEPFYWTPFLPELVVKQCQIVAHAVSTNVNLQSLLKAPNGLSSRFWEYEKYVAPLVYDRMQEITWQSNKMSDNLYRKADAYFWEAASIKQKLNLVHTLEYFEKKIDPSEFNDNNIFNGIKPKISRFYLIKKEEHV